MRPTVLLILGSISAALPQPTLSAQSAQRPGNPSARGVSVDRFAYDELAIIGLSYRISGVRPNALNQEFGVSFFPEALRVPALLFAPDLGAAYHVRLPSTTLLFKAGGSALTGFGQDILFVPGLHFGGGVIFRIDQRTGIRIDAIRHYYHSNGDTEQVWSLGLGLTGLPPLVPVLP